MRKSYPIVAENLPRPTFVGAFSAVTVRNSINSHLDRITGIRINSE